MQGHTLCCRDAHDFVYKSANLLLKIDSTDRENLLAIGKAAGALSHKVNLLAICQAFWDIALDLTWVEDQQGPALVLTAALPLQAGWQLRHEQLMQGSPFEAILMDWGLRAAAHAMQGVPLPLPHLI